MLDSKECAYCCENFVWRLCSEAGEVVRRYAVGLDSIVHEEVCSVRGRRFLCHDCSHQFGASIPNNVIVLIALCSLLEQLHSIHCNVFE